MDLNIPAKPIVADGHHNAFASFIRWRDRYWLAHRRGSGHTARDGVLVVLGSADLSQWEEIACFDTGADDRDAQFVVFEDRLWLYFNSLDDGCFKVYASVTDDGGRWSAPQRVYQDGYILWKPLQHDGLLYAGAHRPGTDAHRRAELVCSDDGTQWERVSTIRAGTGESETALSFAPDGRLTAFLRDQTRIGGAILEANPPYTRWSERPAGVHLSGQAVYTFDGLTYLFSRVFACDPPVAADAPRAALPKDVDQGTALYTYEGGSLRPYSLLGPLQGNHDSSYATALRRGNEMLVVFHRARHEYAGEYCLKDAADLHLARVPLKQSEPAAVSDRP